MKKEHDQPGNNATYTLSSSDLSPIFGICISSGEQGSMVIFRLSISSDCESWESSCCTEAKASIGTDVGGASEVGGAFCGESALTFLMMPVCRSLENSELMSNWVLS